MGEVAHQIHERVVALGETPHAVHLGEYVVVTAGDDRGERTFVDLLKHGVVGARRGAVLVVGDLDDDVGDDVLGSRCPIVMEDHPVMPYVEDVVGTCRRGPFGEDDVGVAQKVGSTVEIAGVHRLCVPIQEVGDCGLVGGDRHGIPHAVGGRRPVWSPPGPITSAQPAKAQAHAVSGSSSTPISPLGRSLSSMRNTNPKPPVEPWRGGVAFWCALRSVESDTDDAVAQHRQHVAKTTRTRPLFATPTELYPHTASDLCPREGEGVPLQKTRAVGHGQLLLPVKFPMT